MRTQVKQPQPVSHTIQAKPKSANQANIQTVLQKYATSNVGSTLAVAQRKVINLEKDDVGKKTKIDKALESVKKNPFGKVVYGELNEDKTINYGIIHDKDSRACKNEIMVDTNVDNLDKTLLHEMTHSLHWKITQEVFSFNLKEIYNRLIELWIKLAGKNSISFSKNENDEYGNSFERYWNLQEEELVTQEWEAKYALWENNNHERNIEIREHYFDDGVIRGNIKSTGSLSQSSQGIYQNIYQIDPPQIGLYRLNNYNEYHNYLSQLQTWIEKNASDEIINGMKNRIYIQGLKQYANKYIEKMLKDVVSMMNILEKVKLD